MWVLYSLVSLMAPASLVHSLISKVSKKYAPTYLRAVRLPENPCLCPWHQGSEHDPHLQILSSLRHCLRTRQGHASAICGLPHNSATVVPSDESRCSQAFTSVCFSPELWRDSNSSKYIFSLTKYHCRLGPGTLRSNWRTSRQGLASLTQDFEQRLGKLQPGLVCVRHVASCPLLLPLSSRSCFQLPVKKGDLILYVGTNLRKHELEHRMTPNC